MSTFKAPPKKQLGQHFLADRRYIEQIVLAVDPQPGDRLVEIGPGQGAITFPLLRRQGELTVIEFDRDLITPLMEASEGIGRLTIIHKDVLQVDFSKLAGDEGGSSGTCRTTSPRRSCSTRWNTPARCATCTSCCRRKSSTAWPPCRAARCTAGSA